jgi:hypothetical protein
LPEAYEEIEAQAIRLDKRAQATPNNSIPFLGDMNDVPMSPNTPANPWPTLPISTRAAASLFHPILAPIISERKLALLLAGIGTL